MVFAKIKQKGNRVIVKFIEKPTSDDDCMNYLRLLEKIYAQQIPFVILFDARDLSLIPLKYIKMQAAFMKKQEALTKKYMLRTSIVVSSPTAKILLKTLFRMRKPAAPYRIFTTIAPAKEFLTNANLARLPEENEYDDDEGDLDNVYQQLVTEEA